MKQRLLFLGPPGAGKGTQADRLCKKNNLLHLSTGDLLRSEVQAGTDLGQKAQTIMSKGGLVSDELVLSIVKNKLIGLDSGWLLDGFPRNVFQAQALEDLLVQVDQPIQLVVFLKIDDGLLIQRLLARGRDDDNEEVIRHRLEVYKNMTAPLVDHYRGKGLLKAISGSGTIDEISNRIQEILE